MGSNMKKSLLALLFVCSSVFAGEVTVTGYGSNYHAALENAKTSALEKGASTFIIAESNARNGRVEEKIDQYNGGVIKSYRIVDHRSTAMGYEVTIVADVVPKNNTQKRTTTPFNIGFDEYEKRERVVRRLDDVGKAIHANIANPQTKIGREETTISTNIELSWQQKWLSDMKLFTSTINEKGKTTSNARESLAGGVTTALIGVHPLAGALGWEVLKPDPIQLQDNMMVCFGMYIKSSVDCFNLDVDMTMPRNPKIVVIGKVQGQDVFLHEQYLEDSKMYKFVSAGDSRYNRFFPNYKTTYNQPALVIFENEKQSVPVKFAVNNELVKQLESVQVYLR
jgi:hypothetical protein